MSIATCLCAVEPKAALARFRRGYHGCLYRRGDALFELTDAVLCSPAPVRSLVELALEPEFQRGHGALYDAVNAGWMEFTRLRHLLATTPVPKSAEGRIVLAVDVTAWLHPAADTSPERRFCHVSGYGTASGANIPGWPYSFLAALEPGRSSWTAILDAQRVAPGDDVTELTADQIRETLARLIRTSHRRESDPDVLVVLDAGYDATRLAWLLSDLPIELVVRVRSDRVYYTDPGEPVYRRRGGRPARHGQRLTLSAGQDTWPAPDHRTVNDTRRYGRAETRSWDRMHQQLQRHGPWAKDVHLDEELPVVHGTLIRLTVAHLPSERTPAPVWLWTSRTGADATHIDRLWSAYLRRFDLEHTFRLFKQTLGWTAPRLRDPHSADLWTWLVIAVYTQLRLARPLAEDHRRPWERPKTPRQLTPARVRRGFRHIRPHLPSPTGVRKPTTAGPGRPPGRRNTIRAARPAVGAGHQHGAKPESRLDSNTARAR
ncbi:NF041680 family putative transposase [Streptomyces acidiscabies]|uniref:NF041680 family putative transposase n=1 Tax=Streptomyces acidiscabies TaxID=42234 RepID=UPI000962E9C3|nr:NF041680 family putative transposase [Streptomyces acidiscabies]GAV43641.1 transposase DDE domain protein [Streptomyces acidiscabies]